MNLPNSVPEQTCGRVVKSGCGLFRDRKRRFFRSTTQGCACYISGKTGPSREKLNPATCTPVHLALLAVPQHACAEITGAISMQNKMAWSNSRFYYSRMHACMRTKMTGKVCVHGSTAVRFCWYYSGLKINIHR
jgi:hypothetical protein